MTHHSRLNLIMFATIAGLVVFLYFRPQSDAIQEYPVSTAAVEAAQSLRILNRQQEIAFKQLNNQWRMIKPISATANEKKIGEILKILTAISYQRFSLKNPERFSLDQPYLQLYVNDEYFGFGGFSPVTNQQYIATNDFVYLISPHYGLALSVTASDLISLELLAPDEIPVKFETDQWAVEFQNDNWHIVKHRSDTGFDTETVTRWIQLWQTAQAEILKFKDELGSDFVARGVIQINMQSGCIVKFNILQNKYSLVLLRMPEEIGYQFSIEMGRRLIDPGTISLDQ